jgi:hypothetical protein
MRGREYLELAREWVTGPAERHWRGAVGRAYYALMLECREALSRWGFPPLPRDNVHTFVRLRFAYPANPDMKQVGDVLEELGRFRNKADYNLSALAIFATPGQALQAVQDAATALALLDAIAADPARQAAAIAAIRKAFP